MRGPDILVVYAGKIPTANIIMQMMEQVVKRTGGALKGRLSCSVRKKDIRWADVIIFIRGADPYMEEISYIAKKSRRYCVMYLDDDLLNVPQQEGDNVYKKALRECLANCDVLWSSNTNILKKYKKYMNGGKTVEEKAFSPVKDLIEPCPRNKEPLKILYAGSTSHQSELQEVIVPALNRLWKENTEMEVTFIGFHKDCFKDIQFPCKTIPWFSQTSLYEEYMRKEKFHIGLAVVRDDEFSRCKFYNKFLEYTKYGMAGVYSKCEPYSFIIENENNGYLVENTPQAWKEAIQNCGNDEKKRLEIIGNAQKMIREEFVIEKVAEQLTEYEIVEFKEYHAAGIYPVIWTPNLLKRYFGQSICIWLSATKVGKQFLNMLVKGYHCLKKLFKIE